MKPPTVEAIYEIMATKARYRPQAPSDGMGNITVPEEELNLKDEARRYATRWLAEEHTGPFHIGIPDESTLPATIFAVEAARLLCAGVTGNATALQLLKLAVENVEQQPPAPRSVS